MNDERSGQLTGAWVIPPYARELLWLESEAGAVRCEGEHGLFTLPDALPPGAPLTVRWGSADGAALVQLAWQPDALGWAGDVRIGGYVDALYAGPLEGINDPISLLYLSGAPLRVAITPFPGIAQRGQSFAPPRFHDDVSDMTETVTTWLGFDGSAPMALAQDALVTKLPVFAFGRLANATWAWSRQFALPILLDGLTVLPG